jgi:hypothetical protein
MHDRRHHGCGTRHPGFECGRPRPIGHRLSLSHHHDHEHHGTGDRGPDDNDDDRGADHHHDHDDDDEHHPHDGARRQGAPGHGAHVCDDHDRALDRAPNDSVQHDDDDDDGAGVGVWVEFVDDGDAADGEPGWVASVARLRELPRIAPRPVAVAPSFALGFPSVTSRVLTSDARIAPSARRTAQT